MRYLEPCPPEWNPVEVRHLLNHSSGLPELENGWFAEGHGSLSEAYAAILSSGDDLALVAEPGTTFRYSNGGYTLLSRIIEIADARAIEDAIRDRVFLPSGMASAGMERAPAPEVDPWYRGHVVIDRLANGYNGTADEVRTAYSLMYTVPGAGGVYGTADDLAAFASALFGGRLIPDDLRRRMLTPVPTVSERYADGWVVRERDGHRYFAHTGGTNGFLSSLEYYPDTETTIVVLSNLGFAALGEVASGLADVALDQRQE